MNYSEACILAFYFLSETAKEHIKSPYPATHWVKILSLCWATKPSALTSLVQEGESKWQALKSNNFTPQPVIPYMAVKTVKSIKYKKYVGRIFGWHLSPSTLSLIIRHLSQLKFPSPFMTMPSSAHKETVEGIAAPSKESCVQQGTAEAEAIFPEVLGCAAWSDRVIVMCGLILEHIPW